MPKGSVRGPKISIPSCFLFVYLFSFPFVSGASGYSAQAGAPVYSAQAGASGYSAQTGAPVYSAQAGAPVYSAQAGASGYSAQAGASGYSAQTGASGYSAQAGTPVSRGQGQNGGAPSPTWPSPQGQYPSSQGSVPSAGSPAYGGGPSNSSSQANLFLAYYSRQGSPFLQGDTWFFSLKNDKRSLERKKMSRNDFQKSLIIFFGDWCPSCASFFGNFSEIVKLLTMYGVKVILVSVPSIEVLKNWRNPTVEELLSAAAKVELLGIVLVPNKVFVLALADKNTLAAAGIDGLPVVVAVKDGKEAFRAVGSDAANKLRLTDVRVLKQFMEIWEVDERESDDDAARLGDTGGKPRLVDLPDGSVCVAASLSRRRLSSALKKKSLMRGFGPRSSRRPLPSIPAIPVGTASWADVLNSRPFRPLRDSPLSSR